MLHLYAALAEKERALISTRTPDALARAKAAGKKLGGNRGHVIDAAATARSAEVRKAVSAERKADVLPVIRDLQAAGVTTLQAIADGLNAKGLTTPRGKGVGTSSSVSRFGPLILRNESSLVMLYLMKQATVI